VPSPARSLEANEIAEPRPGKASLRSLARSRPGGAKLSLVAYPDEAIGRLAQVEDRHFWFAARRNFVLRLLTRHLPQGGIGADFGCGSCYTAAWLTARGYRTIGVDAHEDPAQERNARHAAGFVRANLRDFDLEPELDFITLLDVLEHVEDDAGYLEHATRALKPGGIALISVPALRWLWSASDVRTGHHRRYEKSSLRRLAARAMPGAREEFLGYYYFSTLPALVARRRGNEDDSFQDDTAPPRPAVNRVAGWVLGAEAVLALTTGVPLGSSLFAVFRKEG
jgi:SAM-dependent methyltransferase